MQKDSSTKTESSWLTMLKWLCFLDLAFIIMYVVALFNLPEGWLPIFDLGSERTLPEYFQYLKLALTALMLWTVAINSRKSVYLGWSILFSYLLCDDAFALHELFGTFINDASGESIISRYVMGEQIATFSLGIGLLGIVGIGYLRAKNHDKLICLDYCVLLGIVVFFGVFVDYAHAIFGLYRWVDISLTIVEDGGELIAFTLCLVYTYQFYRSQNGDHRALTSWLLPIAPNWTKMYLRLKDVHNNEPNHS